MRLIFVLGLLVILLFTTACAERVEVPPAHVGKVLTQNGYKPEVVPPSKFRLDMCLLYCDKLVTLPIADFVHLERLKVFMPKDQRNMSFDVRMTGAISSGVIDHAVFGNQVKQAAGKKR
ncbi:hypothetical protein ACL7TT_12930 [Microbulbifer sp. 2304DJ12-6]|uniref:hypothetical protein n=1 Tax=Microbulbifer sp. 2304DJ12-6 TaxID=3233340 RepID=UPI0039B060CE